MKINCIIQARMTSERFPGKVMVEVGGKPLIGHLLDNIVGAPGINEFIVAIPDGDEKHAIYQHMPLYQYCMNREDVRVVLGPEHDVAGRFCNALREYPCDAFIRVCADSPCLDKGIISAAASCLQYSMFAHLTAGVAGTQVQGVLTDTFLAFVDEFDEEEREHVLSYFANRCSLAVDTPEDLERVRPLLEGRIDVSEWVAECLA